MFMGLHVIFLFPNKLVHTGTACTALPKMGSCALWVWPYDSLCLASVPWLTPAGEMRCQGRPGVPGNGRLAQEGFCVFCVYTDMIVWLMVRGSTEQLAAETESRTWKQGDNLSFKRQKEFISIALSAGRLRLSDQAIKLRRCSWAWRAQSWFTWESAFGSMRNRWTMMIIIKIIICTYSVALMQNFFKDVVNINELSPTAMHKVAITCIAQIINQSKGRLSGQREVIQEIKAREDWFLATKLACGKGNEQFAEHNGL